MRRLIRRMIGRKHLGTPYLAEDHVELEGCTLFENVRIGYRSYANNTMIRHNTTIGRYCSIGRRCTIGAARHDLTLLTTHPIGLAREPQGAQIGNDVWIGDGVILLDGIIVGDGAVIGANAVVAKDVAPYAIVGGVPAKLIRMRFDQTIVDQLMSFRWWEFGDDILQGIDMRDVQKALDVMRARSDSLSRRDVRYESRPKER